MIDLITYRALKPAFDRFQLVVLFVVFAFFGNAQVNISGMINQNAPVLSISQPNCSDCDPTCKDTIFTVGAGSFQIGDRALVIQMKGATINISNTAAGGQITSIANAGNYEFFIIDSINPAGSIIIPVYGLVKQYDAAGQVIG